MSTFKLQIAFSDAELKAIYESDTRVIVAKPSKDGNDPNVAWQVFKPFQANTLAWKEEYGIYASTSEVKNGAQLSQLSSVPVGASMNKLYVLEDNATITGPLSGGEAHSYALTNKYSGGIIPGTDDPNKRIMTVGLFQDANVNGTDIKGNAVSAAPVLLASTAIMTPYTTVYIWLQSEVKSNSVVTTVTSVKTALTFGGGKNSISVTYDAPSGKFLPA
jgi:hypothetical protein